MWTFKASRIDVWADISWTYLTKLSANFTYSQATIFSFVSKQNLGILFF